MKSRFIKNGGWLFIASIFLFGLNGLLFHSFVGFLGVACFILGFKDRVATWSFLADRKRSRYLYGSMLSFSVFVSFLLVPYFLLGLSYIVVITAYTLFIASLLLFKQGDDTLFKENSGDDISNIYLVLSIVSSLLVVLMVFFLRTGEPLISPWNILPSSIFFLFFISLFALLYGSRNAKGSYALGAGTVFVFMATSVSAIIYAQGFGFDPFIHRAAIEALVEHGRIQPLQILYSGQYVLVAALRHLTAFPIKVIDIWLVPVLFSVLVPVAGTVGLSEGWKLSAIQSRSLWPVLFLIPFMLLTFTVPFTFTYAFFLIVIFLLPSVNGIFQAGSMLLLSGILVLFHPLLAVPTLIFILAFVVYRHCEKKYFSLGLLMFFSAVSVPSMFILYQWKLGQSVLFSGLWDRFPLFLNLFRNPFYDPYPYIPLYLDLMYDFRYFIPIVLSLFSVGVVLIFWTELKKIVLPYLVFSFGLLLCIFALSTMFTFKGIINHEQGEFALRLLQVWYVLPLPIVVYGFAKMIPKRREVPVFIILSFFITLSWYFSYPQFNLQFPFFSPGVSDQDIETVLAIEERSDEREYLVLSNQMTSAAALQELGFAYYHDLEGEKVLWYAIPTGGPLYAYYSRIIFQGGRRDAIDELHAESNVDLIYLVFHEYTPWRNGFVEELERTADGSFTAADEKVIIYEYIY